MKEHRSEENKKIKEEQGKDPKQDKKSITITGRRGKGRKGGERTKGRRRDMKGKNKKTDEAKW